MKISNRRGTFICFTLAYRYYSMIMPIKKYFIALMMGALLSVSCNNPDTAFMVDSFAQFTIPAGANPLLISVFEEEVIFPFQSQLDVSEFTDADIVSVNADNAILLSAAGSSVDLNFIHVVEVFAVNPDDPSDSKEVFHIDPAEFGQKTDLRLFPSLPDIKDFVRNERIRLKIEMEFRVAPPRTLDMVLEMQFSART